MRSDAGINHTGFEFGRPVVSAELLSVVVVVPGRRQRVAGVSARHEAGDVQPEVVRLRRQPEVAVLGPVRLVVPRDHLNAQAIIPYDIIIAIIIIIIQWLK